MFLSGTLLNVATVLIGSTIGLVAASRVGPRLRESLQVGLGMFTLVMAVQMGLKVFQDPVARPSDALVVVGGLLLGVVVGEGLRIHDRLEAVGGWFQRRLSREGSPSRMAEAFVTGSPTSSRRSSSRRSCCGSRISWRRSPAEGSGRVPISCRVVTRWQGGRHPGAGVSVPGSDNAGWGGVIVRCDPRTGARTCRRVAR